MPSPNRPAAIVFDMDGLIFDTEALYEEAVLIEARARGFAAIDHAVVRQTIGLSWSATRDLFRRLIPQDADIDAFIGDWMNQFERLAEVRLATKPGVGELLDLLDELAIPFGLATGSDRKTATGHLETHGLLHRFRVIVAAEDCRAGKPEPEPFLRAAAGLGVSPRDCWALEDSINGVASAHRAGMVTIMVPDLIAPDAETAARCAFVVNSLVEVASLLRG